MFQNINAQLYLPVIEGMWKQHELWDGTYTFNDWLDVLEIIRVRTENKERYYDSLERRN